MTIGERIKQMRIVKGITQRELAEMSGLATGTIQQYELKKRQPRLEPLQKIADALGISTMELIGQAEFGDAPEGVSPEHPIAFPGLEKKTSEIGYFIKYGCDYADYDDNAIWIIYPDGEKVFISVDELETLNLETNVYLKFRLDELRKRLS